MSVLVIFTGPEDKKLIRLRLPGRHMFQRIFLKWGEPVLVDDEEALHILKHPGFIQKGFSVNSWLDSNPGEYVAVRRHAALGDVIQLLMSLRDQLELQKKVTIETQNQYKEVVDYFWKPEVTGKPGIIVNFDGLAELDQTDAYYKTLHRVDIFRQTLGMDNTGALPLMMLEDHSDFWAKSTIRTPSEPYVVMNYKGSRPDNTINPDIVLDVIEGLRKNVRVIVMGAPISDHPDNYPDNLDFPSLFKVVANAKCTVVTDSGLLWVSHITHTPVLAMLRETTYETRVRYAHPNSQVLDLKKLSNGADDHLPFVYSEGPDVLVDKILEQLN